MIYHLFNKQLSGSFYLTYQISLEELWLEHHTILGTIMRSKIYRGKKMHPTNANELNVLPPLTACYFGDNLLTFTIRPPISLQKFLALSK